MSLLDTIYLYDCDKKLISKPLLKTLEISLKKLFPLGCLTDIFDIPPKGPLNEILNTVL